MYQFALPFLVVEVEISVLDDLSGEMKKVNYKREVTERDRYFHSVSDIVHNDEYDKNIIQKNLIGNSNIFTPIPK